MLNLCMFLIFQVFYILVVSITSNKSNDLGFFFVCLKIKINVNKQSRKLCILWV